MKRALLFFLALIFCVSAFTLTSYADIEPSGTEAAVQSSAFDVIMTLPEEAHRGETVNVICEIKNIKAKNGIIAVDFQLDYSLMSFEPVIISEDFSDSSPYDVFLIRSPQYIMQVGDQEISKSCYENFTCCYSDGCLQSSYSIKFIDMLNYPMIKEGTDPEHAIKNDGDFILSVPFIIKEDVTVGGYVSVSASMVIGTAAGDDESDPYTVTGNGSFASVLIVGEETETSGTAVSSTESAISTTESVTSTTESAVSTT
ncbi:MAG: hypothetical protein IJS94_03905, partial [Clostridia bacterium]|nr:hypothetical protein [Clostridia bacterium]